MPVRDAHAFFAQLKLTEKQQIIARQILKEVQSRLGFLSDVGLDYLTLARSACTLSGGETFLASLSMAIALSKEIARFGTFDFFFIDEGFGTLHDAALDQALDVLCELSKTSLVGLVTHRTELIGRIPVTLLVTEADGEKGSVCRIAE